MLRDGETECVSVKERERESPSYKDMRQSEQRGGCKQDFLVRGKKRAEMTREKDRQMGQKTIVSSNHPAHFCGAVSETTGASPTLLANQSAGELSASNCGFALCIKLYVS